MPPATPRAEDFDCVRSQTSRRAGFDKEVFVTRIFVALAAIVVPVPIVTLASAEPITTGSLIGEMIDMHQLAEFPSPYYKTVQFSSYDHRSSLPGGPDWFANSDGFGGEPVPNFEKVLKPPQGDEPGEYLICDVAGPGAIVRLWTARIAGNIRMWLDDASEPVYDGSADEFLRAVYRRYAAQAGLDESVFDGTFRQRDACYFPIAFAKRCRIVWIGNHKDIHFYQVQIRRYEPNAQVVTFKPSDLKTYAERIRSVAEVLSSPQAHWKYRSTQLVLPIDASVQPGETKEVLAIDGSKAIERLTLRVSAADLDRALRQTILHIMFDDYPWGQVQSPVGDFFGAAPGINPYDSAAFTVEPDGTMTCRYVMPFAKNCRILLQNLGGQPITATGSVLPINYSWDDARSMHFRARWRVDHDLIASGERVQDMPYLLADGAGRYVGTALMLLNPSDVPSSGGCWWGEGDEKIFVDEDVQPSTFGTGSEDYFNYSWSSADIFVFPYCGQPRNDGPANRGFVTNTRWHILDNLPFRNRLRFYMELFSHEPTPGVSYARIGYHYGRPGLMDDHLAITQADVRHLQLPPTWEPAARGGARNSVFHQAEDVLTPESKERVKTTLAVSGLWAGGRMLVWQPAEPGEAIAFRLPVTADGRYAIHLTTARLPQSGRISVRLDGKRIGFGGDNGIDLHEPYRVLSRDVISDVVDLKQGDHELVLRYEGAPAGVAAPQIGLDFFWVQRRGNGR